MKISTIMLLCLLFPVFGVCLNNQAMADDNSKILQSFKLLQQGKQREALALMDEIIADPNLDRANENVLRMFNNYLNVCLALKEYQKGAALADAIQDVARWNNYIYHNSACVYVAVGRLGKALEQVKLAKEYKYPHMDKIAVDQDLKPLWQMPEFQAAVNLSLSYKDISGKAEPAAGNYQIFIESGLPPITNSDLSVLINQRSLDDYNEYSGEYKEKYDWASLSHIKLNEDQPNQFSFKVTEDAKEIKQKGLVPVLFRIYKKGDFIASIFGTYSAPQDIGKTFSAQIPPLNKIKKDSYYFFSGNTAQKVIIVTTGFAFGSFYDGQIAKSGLPSDMIWFCFIKDNDLHKIFLQFNDKLRAERFKGKQFTEDTEFYCTQPSFCYLDTKTGVIYQKSFSQEDFKSLDTVYIKFKPENYELIAKIPLADKKITKTVEQLFWPTVKEIATRTQKLSQEMEGLSEAESTKKEAALTKKLDNYMARQEPTDPSHNTLASGLFLQSCLELTQANQADYEIKVFRLDIRLDNSLVIAEAYKIDEKIKLPEISLIFTNKDGQITAVYPF